MKSAAPLKRAQIEHSRIADMLRENFIGFSPNQKKSHELFSHFIRYTQKRRPCYLCNASFKIVFNFIFFNEISIFYHYNIEIIRFSGTTSWSIQYTIKGSGFKCSDEN